MPSLVIFVPVRSRLGWGNKNDSVVVAALNLHRDEEARRFDDNNDKASPATHRLTAVDVKYLALLLRRATSIILSLATI